MNNKGHYFLHVFTTIKKGSGFRRNPGFETMGNQRLESDLIFYIGDACIEGPFQKINDLLDSRGEICGEDISV
jgi:hypothetical protein